MERIRLDDNLPLQEDIRLRIIACRSMAKANDFWAFGILFIGVLSSAIATISVGTELFSKVVNAALTSLPGISAMVLTTFKFEARARWWWKKVSHFQKYYYALKHEEADEKEVSKDLTGFLLKHEDEWPSFGKPPSGIIT